VDHLQTDWADWLAIAEFQYNNKVHSSTNYLLFYLNYGRHPWKGEIQLTESMNPSADKFMKALESAREEATAAMTKASERAKTNYDRHRRQSRGYKKDDQVWLEATNLKEARPSKKLLAKRYGPFKVLERISQSLYQLSLPKNWRLIHPVFNEVLLTPYQKPSFPSQRRPPPPPPEIVGDELEYKVKKVLDSRRRRLG
jgi:hypothetical protein